MDTLLEVTWWTPMLDLRTEHLCARCGRLMPDESVNLEARVHHGARSVECKDRQDCERAKRRRARSLKRG